jgi:hypothetical protein
MDPSDRPKDRRLDDEAFTALLEQRAARRSDADRHEAYERLTWFLNQLLEASFLMLPRRYRRRWNGSVSVDATVVPGFARPERRERGNRKWKDRKVLRRSTDPDCGYYVRKNDFRDDDSEPEHLRKGIWGYEASLVVCAHVGAAGDVPLPVLVVAMPPLHEPGREPGRNAIRALKNLRKERSHPAGYLAADNAYSAAKPEDFQMPARLLDYDLVLSYRIDQLGVQGESNGLLQVEGRWYCPAMPEALISATLDYREGRIDKVTYDKRIEARRAQEARQNGKPDAEGYQRLLCPAAQGAPTARCELKPKTDNLNRNPQKRIRPSNELKVRPPKCCTQESVTIPLAAGAKFAQSLALATPQHQAVYAGLRNSVESTNGYLKDGAFQGLADPQRRRVRGVAAQSALVAFQIMASNLRKIDGFLEKMASKVGADRPRRRRGRSTEPIEIWLEPFRSTASDGRAPPGSN